MPALGNSQTTFYQRIKAFKLGIHEAEEQKKGVDGSDAGESEQKGSSVEQKKISEGGHSFKGVGKEVEREFQEPYHSLVAKLQKQNSKVGNVFEEIGEAAIRPICTLLGFLQNTPHQFTEHCYLSPEGVGEMLASTFKL